jgi:hypothetical protein
MFESLKDAIQDLLSGRVAPADRRAAIADMKSAMVSAKLGVEDLQKGVDITRTRLASELEQLVTVQRRKKLAEEINDAETVALAVKFEAQHSERIAVLERKLGAQEAEAELAARELAEMMTALKAANAGVGSGTPRSAPSDEELGLPNDAKLSSELDSLARQRSRAEKDAIAEAKLEELKRRMGQS